MAARRHSFKSSQDEVFFPDLPHPVYAPCYLCRQRTQWPIPQNPLVSSSPTRARTKTCSYAREDEDLREKLEKQLAILRRQGLIETWHDRRIGAGTEWAGAIDRELEAADIVLLLVSADFLASDYINDIELQRAMERHEARTAKVIPVILRPCLWQRGDFAKLQALPRDGEPVISSKWPSQDAALANVAQGIAQAVER